MARRESPLDPSEGPLQAFAHDLRVLRDKQGLTYRQIAVRAGYAHSTIAEATKGKRLPTLDVTLALAQVCGGEPDEWTRRWAQVNSQLSAMAAASRSAGECRPAESRWRDRALRDLAAEVRRLWMSDDESFRFDLCIAEQPGAVRDSHADDACPRLGPSKPLPAGTQLVDLFDDRFNRRCLILGAAGAGKTTMLLTLAQDLLTRAEVTGDGPVPVLLQLSRWTGRSDDLAAWITDEIAEHYKFDTDRIQGWLASGQLTVLLDGLDEVRPDRRAACVRAINMFRRAASSSLTGLVVSSRTADYADLNSRVELGGAVVISALSPAQVDKYLADIRRPSLRTVVVEDPVFAELLTNPLMLSIAVRAYREDDLHPGLDGGSGERRRQLIFDRYVVQALGRDRTPRTGQADAPAGDGFDSWTTHRGLVWLARLMCRRGETIFYPDWFTPGSLPNDAPTSIGCQRVATALTYGIAGGVISGMAYTLHALASNGVRSDRAPDVPPGYGLLIAVVVGLAITLATAFTSPTSHRILRVASCVLVFILAGGLLRGVLEWQRHDHLLAAAVAGAVQHGLAFGISGILSLVFALAIARMLALTGATDRSDRWHWSWWRMERGIFIGVVVSPAVGLAHAVAYTLSHLELNSIHAMLFGLGQGLIMGLTVGLAIGLTFALVDIDTDRPAAQWHWSLRRLGVAMLGAGVYGLVYWLLLLAIQAAIGPASGASFGVLVGLTFLITFALGHGLIPDRTQPPPAPARALSASLRAAIPPAVATALAVALAVTAAARFRTSNLTEALRLTLVTPTVLAAALTFWFTGGGVWLAHHAARWAAARGGLLPRDLLGFLAHADERVLLRRAGGGYQFLHRSLQEHIAARNPDAPTDLMPTR